MGLIKKSAQRQKNQIYMFSPSLIIIYMYTTKEIENKHYDKVKYQLFSVTSLEVAHWQGKSLP